MYRYACVTSVVKQQCHATGFGSEFSNTTFLSAEELRHRPVIGFTTELSTATLVC